MNEEQTTEIVLAGFSWPAVAVLAAAVPGILFLTYRGLRRGGGKAWVLTLLGLRTAALLGLVFALLQPEIVERRLELIKRRFVVLHDGSMSMDLPSGREGQTRQQLVQAELSPREGLIGRLERDFEVQYLEFGDMVREGSRSMLGRSASAGMPRTNLLQALRTTRERHAGEELKGVALITDGADTELPDDPEFARREFSAELDALGVPLFAICPADEAGMKDLGITNIRCSRIAFVRGEWEMEVHYTVLGLSEGAATLVLRSDEGIIDVHRRPIQEGRRQYSVRFTFTPIRTGRLLLEVEIQPRPEEAYTENNRAGVVLSVVRDRIRVLHLAGRPSWDVRFLRRTLKSTPNVDLISFFVLRDPIDDPGRPTPHSYVNLIPFPTEDLFSRELQGFDVMILQNFDYLPFGVQSRFGAYMRNIRNHVVSGGAGLVMIGGERSFDLAGYADSPLADVLPVRLSRGRGTVDETPFRPQLTPLGQRHPITRIEDAPTENAALWKRMPELHGCHVLPGVRTGAAVLLERPAARGTAASAPIVIVGEAGKGRAMAIATDETWKWCFLAAGRGLGNRLYLRFWRNALRWLVREAEGGRLTVSLERSTCHPGETVRGLARALDADYAPQSGAHLELRAVRAGAEGGAALSKDLTADDEGRAAFEFALPEAGSYRIEVRPADAESESEGEAPTALAVLSVEAAGLETSDLRPNEQLLRWIAEHSGGAFYNLAREPAPDRLPVRPGRLERLRSREQRPLWNNWITYGLVVGLLCAEWWSRRRRGVT